MDLRASCVHFSVFHVKLQPGRFDRLLGYVKPRIVLHLAPSKALLYTNSTGAPLAVIVQ